MFERGAVQPIPDRMDVRLNPPTRVPHLVPLPDEVRDEPTRFAVAFEGRLAEERKHRTTLLVDAELRQDGRPILIPISEVRNRLPLPGLRHGLLSHTTFVKRHRLIADVLQPTEGRLWIHRRCVDARRRDVAIGDPIQIAMRVAVLGRNEVRLTLVALAFASLEVRALRCGATLETTPSVLLRCGPRRRCGCAGCGWRRCGGAGCSCWRRCGCAGSASALRRCGVGPLDVRVVDHPLFQPHVAAVELVVLRRGAIVALCEEREDVANTTIHVVVRHGVQHHV